MSTEKELGIQSPEWEHPSTALDSALVDQVSDSSSARYKTKAGHELNYRLVDKLVYPINCCSFCGSSATFHHWVQKNGDLVDNVWRNERRYSPDGLVSLKMDLCLTCHREFIIEAFYFKLL